MKKGSHDNERYQTRYRAHQTQTGCDFGPTQFQPFNSQKEASVTRLLSHLHPSYTVLLHTGARRWERGSRISGVCYYYRYDN